MAKVADRVKETSATTGTGTLNLAGAVSNFITFVAGIGSGNTCYYSIVHQAAAEWEVGIGTVTSGSPDTLSRTTVLASSNSGSLVNLSAGTKDVFVTYPAGRAVLLDAANIFTANQTISNTAPSLVMTDTTASAKSLTIAVDANLADLRESGGAAGSLLNLDLANNRVNIGTASPSGVAMLSLNPVPSASWTISGANPSSLVTIANNGTYDLAAGSGLVILHDNTDGHGAVFFSTNGSTTIISDINSTASVTQGTASKLNFYYNIGTGTYRIENKRGASHDIYITTIMTRPSS